MRLKIIAGNIVVVLLTGIIGFLLIRGQVTDTLRRDITARVRSDARLFDRSWRLSAYEFLNQVENRASDESVRGAMASVGDSRRNRSFDAANDVAGWFQDPARGRSSRPSIVAITDSSGTVVARNQDKNRLNGTLLTKDVPAVGRALAEGRAQHDVWFKSDDGTLLQVGVAPIRNEQGAVVGTLLVGFELTGALAAREAQLLGCDIAFLNPKDIYSSSLDPQAAQNVQASLYGASGSGARTTATLTGGQGAFEWNDTVNGDDWTGVVGRLPMTSSVPVGYAVLADKTQAAGLAGVANIVLVLMAIGIVLVLIYGFVIGGSFLEPLEEIEEGVLAVINGNTQLRLDIDSQEFGGLAYRINQLINVFTGVSESDDGTPMSDSGEWQGSEFQGSVAAGARTSGEPAGGAAASTAGVIDDPAIAGPLGQEAEADYLARLFREYAEAKTAGGESVSNLTQDRFAERLQRNAESLQKKHGVRMVRFVVEAKGGVVSLKPVLIR